MASASEPTTASSGQLQKNLNDALAAVRYVKSKMALGPSNTVTGRLVKGIGYALLGWETATGCLNDKVRSQTRVTGPRWPASRISRTARLAENAGCGNCGEQSSIAFEYLVRHGAVRPLELMHLPGGKHAFVVIGRTKSSLHDVQTWGSSAVICDPWDEKAYPAVDVADRMYGGWGRPARFTPRVVHVMDH